MYDIRPVSAIRLSLQTFVSIWPVIFLALMLTLLGKIASPNSGALSVRGLMEVGLIILVAFAAYNHLLSGTERSGLRALQPKKPSALILFVIASALTIAAVTQLNMESEPTPGVDFLAPFLALFWLVVGLVAVAKLGTIFPAIVDGGDLSPRAALSRNRTWSLVWRLLGFLVISFGTNMLSMAIVMKTMNPREASVLGEAGAGVVIIFNLIYLAILLATLFSKAYLGSYSDTWNEADLNDAAVQDVFT